MTTKKPDWNTQTKISIILGVSRQAIQKLCKGKFKPAVKDGKVNLWHPIVQQHKAELESKRASKSGPKQKKETKSTKVTARTQTENGTVQEFQTEVSFDEIENLTIKQVVEKYGGILGFKNYVDVMDKMAAWKNREQKYQKDRKKLVELNPVAQSLFSIINIAFKRILEYPPTVTDQLFAMALSGKKTARIDALTLQEQTLSKILKSVKKEALKGIKDAEKD